MAKYNFLVKKLEEAANNWAQYGMEDGSMYSVLKKLHDFYATNTVTHKAEVQLWEQIADNAEQDDVMEFVEDVQGFYEEPEVDRLTEMELHQALIVVLPHWLVA